MLRMRIAVSIFFVCSTVWAMYPPILREDLEVEPVYVTDNRDMEVGLARSAQKRALKKELKAIKDGDKGEKKFKKKSKL